MGNVLLINKFQTFIHRNRGTAKAIDPTVFGKRVGLAAKLFGCWHDNLSRPFTNGKTSYRSCLNCGARKPFDTETLETGGSFYYPPLFKTEKS